MLVMVVEVKTTVAEEKAAKNRAGLCEIKGSSLVDLIGNGSR